MAIRRVNSTGRMKILREDAQVFVRGSPDGQLAFEALLDLKDYELPGDAKVFVEAYRQTSFMRFAHGTVAEPQAPEYVARQLTEFSSPDGVLFRVKVTSTGDRAGVLLAEGDRIPATDDQEQPDNRVPLLPPAPEDLDHEVWRLNFDGAGGPLLLINKHVGDWKAVAGSPVFRSLVYPAAMRAVLWHIFKVEEVRAMDDLQDWKCRWLTFAAKLPGVGEPPLASEEDGDWDPWISSAVESFARSHKFLDHYKTLFSEVAL